MPQDMGAIPGSREPSLATRLGPSGFDPERGDLRVIYTDAGGMATPSMQRELGEEVWALVGPIGDHTSHPELQDAIGLVAMAFNRRRGRLSAEKHAELLRRENYGEGAELLAEALSAKGANDGPE
jgi:hypothetical protein